MKLYICSTCHQHFIGQQCERCLGSTKTRATPKVLGLALLLGLGLSACEKEGEDTGKEDSASEPAEEPAAEPDNAALYGVEEGD